MFQQPLMMPQEEMELTLDEKLKKFKEKRVKEELDRALRRNKKTNKNNKPSLFTKLQSTGDSNEKV